MQENMQANPATAKYICVGWILVRAEWYNAHEAWKFKSISRIPHTARLPHPLKTISVVLLLVKQRAAREILIRFCPRLKKMWNLDMNENIS
jgi:hypothetical protein